MNMVKKLARSVWSWLVVLSLIAGISFLSFRSNFETAGKATLTRAQMPATEFSVITRGFIDIEGGLINLSVQRTGVMKDVLVQAGDVVVAGQVLASQDDRGARIRLQETRLSLENVQIQLDETQLELENAVKNEERGRIQREQDAIPQSQYKNMADGVTRARLNLKTQKNALTRATLAMDNAAFDLSLRELRAPVDGRVVKVNITPGTGVSAQNVSTAIMMIPDGDKIIRVALNEQDAELVFVGQSVDVTRVLHGQEPYPATVTSVAEVFSNALERANAGPPRVGSIEVIINAGDIPLKLGQEALVKFRKADEAM